jgi:hypothetical protein
VDPETTEPMEPRTMWEIPQNSSSSRLSYDAACLRCGHAVHVFHSCSDGCGCAPVLMIGDRSLAA